MKNMSAKRDTEDSPNTKNALWDYKQGVHNLDLEIKTKNK